MNHRFRHQTILVLLCFLAAFSVQTEFLTPMVKAAATYTITYDANGGTGAPKAQTKTEGEILTLSETVPVRSGYRFEGWAAILTAELFEPGDLFFYDSDTELVAVWDSVGGEEETYTVSYDANGGAGAPEPQVKQAGVDLTLSTQKPSRTGYAFQGWSESPDSDIVEYEAGGRFLKDKNITLYAVWKKTTSDRVFNVSRDAYAFNNSKSAFEYATTGKGEAYPIPYDPSVKLLFGDTVAGKNFWRVAQNQGWYGNCCGMSTTAALFFSCNEMALSHQITDIVPKPMVILFETFYNNLGYN